MSRFWNFVAAIAHHMALSAERNARVLKDDAELAIRRSEWWSDVQAWADGAEDWPTLKHLRRQRLQKAGRAS